ncbi:hypothetical protein AAG747_27810 [Rapidithrix thailandica]|uniref:Uncharacterized protein n=1 Tax=Rapidithrix thailandica TaxID=413964 RepID=A0AAW9SD60_9BACT
MTGQIIGSLGGTGIIPEDWMDKYKQLKISKLIEQLTNNWNF